MNRILFSTVIVGLAAGSAWADTYTPLNPSGDAGGGAADLYNIFVANYGAAPGGQSEANFNSATSTVSHFGSYTFTRVLDTGGTSGPTDLHALTAPGTNDSFFHDGTTQVKFTVKYAGNSNTLGWVDGNGDPATNFQTLLGDGTPGSTTTVPHLSSNFQLALDSNGTYWSSDASKQGGDDHMVTFFVQGFGRSFYVIGWEDLPLGGADKDYNDWVGEIQAVPLPPAAWAGVSTLAGIAGFGYIRRRKLNVG